MQRVNERGDTGEPPGAGKNPGIYQTVGQGKGVSCEDLKHIPSAVAFLFQREPQVSHVLVGGGEQRNLTVQSSNKVTFLSKKSLQLKEWKIHLPERAVNLDY